MSALEPALRSLDFASCYVYAPCGACPVSARSDLPKSARLLLIDDGVTKGRTLLAAAVRLHEAFPQARITAFALLRTLGFKDHIEGLLDPCVGRIGWRAGDAHRNP